MHLLKTIHIESLPLLKYGVGVIYHRNESIISKFRHCMKKNIWICSSSFSCDEVEWLEIVITFGCGIDDVHWHWCCLSVLYTLYNVTHESTFSIAFSLWCAKIHPVYDVHCKFQKCYEFIQSLNSHLRWNHWNFLSFLLIRNIWLIN